MFPPSGASLNSSIPASLNSLSRLPSSVFRPRLPSSVFCLRVHQAQAPFPFLTVVKQVLYYRKAMFHCRAEVPPGLVPDSGHVADSAKLQEWNIKKKAGLGNGASLHVFRQGPEASKAYIGRIDISARHAHSKTWPVLDPEATVFPGVRAGRKATTVCVAEDVRPDVPGPVRAEHARRNDGADSSAGKGLIERETVVEGLTVFEDQRDFKAAG